MAGARARMSFHTGLHSDDDYSVEQVQPTPPYKRIASSSNVHLDDMESPPYRQQPSTSRVNLGESVEVPQGNINVPVVHYPSKVDVRPHTPASDDGLPGKAVSIAGTDDEDHHEEDYDWSTDDDLLDEEAKSSQSIHGKGSKKRGGAKRVATFFLSTLLGSTLLAAVITAVPLLLHFFYYRPHPSEHRKYITDNVSAWLYWAAANILLSWYLAMIVDIVPVICTFVIGLVWGVLTESVRSRIELYNAAKDKIKPLFYGASAWISWVVVFEGIYHLHDHSNETKSRATYTRRMYQVIQFLFFFTLVLSVEKMLTHMIAFAFHRKAFGDRISALKSHLKVVDHLRNYRPKRTAPKHTTHRHIFSFPTLQALAPGHKKSGFHFGFGDSAKPEKSEPSDRATKSRTNTLDMYDDDGHSGDVDEERGHGGHFSHKGKRRKSRVPPGATHGTVEGLPHMASADRPYESRGIHTYPPSSQSPEQSASPRTGKSTPTLSKPSEEEPAIVFQAAKALKSAVLHDARNITGNEDSPAALGLSVNSAHEAKRLARSIYTAFRADPRRDYLIPSDFYPAYPKREDAEDAFKVFDKDDNGDISRAEIKTTVLKLYKERRALNRSLRDVGNALNTLDWMMIFFAMVVLFFISLSVFNISVGKSLTSFYTIGIAASFIFKNSASSAFDAVMFLFVTHPFDTGDRCFIDDENLVVKKMGLFATTFLRADGTETYYFNSQLFTKFITNVRRSGKMFEGLTLQVAWRTPLEKLDQLEKCMNRWLETEENRWFDPKTSVTLQKIEYQRCLEFTMGIGHNGTWQDWGLRNARKTAFIAATHYYCRLLGITFHESPRPVTLVESQEELARMGAGFPDDNEPLSPASPRSGEPPVDRGAATEAGNEKESTLGFVPPPENLTSLRVRKSKGRRGKFRGDMGDIGGS